MLRFGSVKCGKTAFFLLAVALTLQYLCIRYAALGKSKAGFLSSRLQYLCIRKVETLTGTAASYRRSLPPV